MENKSELLNQLKIDREEKPAAGFSGRSLIVAVVISIVAGIAGARFFFTPAPEIIEIPTKQSTVLPSASASTDGSEDQGDRFAGSTAEKILDASGYITARRMATVSSEVMGLITEVNVEEGMEVEAGQVLAKLDSAIATANLEFAQAQTTVAEERLIGIEASLAEAERVLARAIRLNEESFSSEASVTAARSNADSLRASLASAKADVAVHKIEAQRQRERLDNHTIRAPFDGVVTVKNAQPGEIVSPSSAGGGFTRTGICTIVDMASLEIEVDVNEAFIGKVFTGQKVEANLDAYPDWKIPASVIAIIPTADRAKATVRVRIRILERDTRILPDMGVKVAFLSV